MNLVVGGHFEPGLTYSLQFFHYIDSLFVDKLLHVLDVPDTDFEAAASVSDNYLACIIGTGKRPYSFSVGDRVVIAPWDTYNLLHHGVLNHEDIAFVVGNAAEELAVL